jgi:hypothetical protein
MIFMECAGLAAALTTYAAATYKCAGRDSAPATPDVILKLSKKDS